MKQLSGIDASFLYLETPAMHLHVVGLTVLDPATVPGGYRPDLVHDIVESRLHLLPSFRHRVVMDPAGIDHPRWIEDAEFDLHHHVRRWTLPEGTAEDLAEFVGDFASEPLPRDRPLWELVVVDGLADGTVALVSKLHHAIMSGPAGPDAMARLFDLSPDGGTTSPDHEWQPEAMPSAARRTARSAASVLRRLPRIPRAVAELGVGAVRAARVGITQRGSGSPLPFTAPRTPFSGAITPWRAVAFGRCPLDDLRFVKRAFHVTINDVVLAATTASLRAYLMEHDALPDKPLVASVPVAVGEVDETSTNPLSMMFVGLPVHLEDPVQQLVTVHENTRSAKSIQAAMGQQMLRDWTEIAPPVVMQTSARAYGRLRLASRHPPIHNLVVSNVAGPPVELYCAGARVVAIYPLGPVMDGAGLNLTVMSELGVMNLGLVSCRDMVPDPDTIVAGWIEAVQELHRAAEALSPAG
ncbi:MAG: wax ester/triacylglycerol synthase family O-acyltransferase [Acidimicrobiia bacterium]